jgi:hypothetical protein
MTAITAHHYHQSAYSPRHQQHQHQQHALAASSSKPPTGLSADYTAENDAHVIKTHSPSLFTPRSGRDNPDQVAPSAAMPSRLDAHGPPAAERDGSHLTHVESLRKRGAGPINSRPDSAVDSSDSDRRVTERPPNQKKLSIITSQDDGVHDHSQRPKPPLLRSKSDYAARRDEPEDGEDEIYEWGARHGFEDHYQSADVISQLANVSEVDSPSLYTFLLSWHCDRCDRPNMASLRQTYTRLLSYIMPPDQSYYNTSYSRWQNAVHSVRRRDPFFLTAYFIGWPDLAAEFH